MRATLAMVMLMAGAAPVRAQEWAPPPPRNDLPPAAVAGLPPVQAIGGLDVMGISCAVAAGEVWCWGDCSRGVCGPKGADQQHKPRKVPGLRAVAHVQVSPTAACAHHTDGDVSCWGSGDSGLFGGKDGYAAPRRMSALGKAGRMAHGPGFVCAIAADRKVRCLGSNYHGELGQGPVWRLRGTGSDATLERIGRDESRAPLLVRGVADAIDLTAGGDFACGLTAAGKVFCWGEAQKNGEVPPKRERSGSGIVQPAPRSEPAELIRDGDLHEIVLPRPAIAISAVARSARALLDDGTVAHWNYYSKTPRVEMSRGLPPVRALGKGTRYVITGTGQVHGGGGHAQPGLPAVEEVSGSCARTAAGEVWCWGTNAHGELGRPATPYFVP